MRGRFEWPSENIHISCTCFFFQNFSPVSFVEQMCNTSCKVKVTKYIFATCILISSSIMVLIGLCFFTASHSFHTDLWIQDINIVLPFDALIQCFDIRSSSSSPAHIIDYTQRISLCVCVCGACVSDCDSVVMNGSFIFS